MCKKAIRNEKKKFDKYTSIALEMMEINSCA